MTALDTDAVTQKAVTQPRSYDVADIEYFLCKKIFPTGVLQPMDTKKIKLFGEIVPIFTTGKLTPGSHDRAGHGAQYRGLRARQGIHEIRAASHRMGDADPHYLQLRYARHPP